MNASFRKVLMAVMIVSLTFSIIACSSSLEGKYANATGTVVIEFSSDKAYLTMGVVTSEGSYKVEGNTVIIEAEGERVVLTRNSDGSLSGPKNSFIGRLTRKQA